MINMSYDKELDSDKEESIYPEGYDCYTHQSHKMSKTNDRNKNNNITK